MDRLEKMKVNESARRDTQRRKLYRAEQSIAWGSLPGGGADQLTLAEIEELANSILTGRWFKSRYAVAAHYPSLTMKVKDGRRSSHARATAQWISMPRHTRSRWITLHELAHVIARRQYPYQETAGHGREYARIYLALVTRYISKEAGKALREAFAAHKVRTRGTDLGAAMRRAQAAKAREVNGPRRQPAALKAYQEQRAAEAAAETAALKPIAL